MSPSAVHYHSKRIISRQETPWFITSAGTLSKIGKRKIIFKGLVMRLVGGSKSLAQKEFLDASASEGLPRLQALLIVRVSLQFKSEKLSRS